MLNRIWLGLLLSGFLSVSVIAVWEGSATGFAAVMQAMNEMMRTSVNIAFGLIGIMGFWLGIFEIAQKSGLIEQLARWVTPLLTRLMPSVPANHPAFGSVTMNVAANMLGLDNAATPLGIKAIKDLQSINTQANTISDAQLLFLVLNTSSLTLFPITVFVYRAEQGAVAPTDVFIPILLSTLASSIVGLMVVCYRQGISLLQRSIILYAAVVFALIASLLIYFAGMSAAVMGDASAAIANATLVAFISFVLWRSHVKRIDAFSAFVTGAKQGFKVAIELIPYLLAMLVAIAVFRASGLLELIILAIKSLLSHIGADTRFVDALPTAIMKPLSGSGSRAMMIDTMQTFGADSFAGRLSATMQGSTETTFYVIAVYLGAVGITRTRYLVSSCLLADAAGLSTAIAVCYWFFG